nr:hypothetical protein [Candidatus Sigynarchaeota archaeon]
MARHLWREDIEQRIAIRTLKDTTRSITTKALRDKFGVSTNIISAALEKSIDDGRWHFWRMKQKHQAFHSSITMPRKTKIKYRILFENALYG